MGFSPPAPKTERLDSSDKRWAEAHPTCYEVGRRRVPLSLLPKLARALSVSIEELIGEEAPQAAPGKRGPVSRAQQQLERIQALPRARQKFLNDLIETALQPRIDD